MRSIVEIIQLSDSSWYLQIVLIDQSDVVTVNTLIPFDRYIYAREAAWLLKLEVNNVRSTYGQFDQAI